MKQQIKTVFPLFRSTAFWNLILLIAVVFTIFILPTLPGAFQPYLIRGVFTIMYFTAIMSLEKRRISLIYLSLLALCLERISGALNMPALTTVSKASNVIFFLFIVTLLIMQVARATEVTAMVILSSIIGYLLLGIIYSIFILFIMQFDPAAYSSVNAGLQNNPESFHYSDSIYFSFVTLATLGYGDIVPLKPYTRSLSILITVTGQFYIAILVALLVGKFASRTVFPEE